MANVNIHVRSSQRFDPSVSGGSDKGFLALKLDWFGGDEVSIFFEDEEQLLAFEEKVSTAVRAFQQSRLQEIQDALDCGPIDMDKRDWEAKHDCY